MLTSEKILNVVFMILIIVSVAASDDIPNKLLTRPTPEITINVVTVLPKLTSIVIGGSANLSCEFRTVKGPVAEYNTLISWYCFKPGYDPHLLDCDIALKEDNVDIGHYSMRKISGRLCHLKWLNITTNFTCKCVSGDEEDRGVVEAFQPVTKIPENATTDQYVLTEPETFTEKNNLRSLIISLVVIASMSLLVALCTLMYQKWRLNKVTNEINDLREMVQVNSERYSSNFDHLIKVLETKNEKSNTKKATDSKSDDDDEPYSEPNERKTEKTTKEINEMSACKNKNSQRYIENPSTCKPISNTRKHTPLVENNAEELQTLLPTKTENSVPAVYGNGCAKDSRSSRNGINSGVSVSVEAELHSNSESIYGSGSMRNRPLPALTKTDLPINVQKNKIENTNETVSKTLQTLDKVYLETNGGHFTSTLANSKIPNMAAEGSELINMMIEIQRRFENYCRETSVKQPIQLSDEHLHKQEQDQLMDATKQLQDFKVNDKQLESMDEQNNTRHVEDVVQEIVNINGNKNFVALYDYNAADSDEVSFVEGDKIVIGVVVDDGWLTGTVERTGETGMIPSNYVKSTDKLNEEIYGQA